MDAVFGEDDHIGGWIRAFGALDKRDDMIDGMAEVVWCGDIQELGLDDAEDDATGRLVETTEATHDLVGDLSGQSVHERNYQGEFCHVQPC